MTSNSIHISQNPRPWLSTLLAALIMILVVVDVRAQADREELLLTFSYPAVGRTYITAIFDYNTNVMYMPARELFDLLEIVVYPSGGNRNSMQGRFLTDGQEYEFNFIQHTLKLGRRTWQFSGNEMFVGSGDVYLSPDILNEVFEMNFDINLNSVTASLRTPHVMPVTERRQREQARSSRVDLRPRREFHPLEYGRNHQVIRMGFMDYSLSTAQQLNNGLGRYNYQLTGGMEFLGGDLQGNYSGAYTETGDFLHNWGNVRWQFVVRNRSWISRIHAGQLSTTGLNPQAVRGLSVTNDPIEARTLFGETVIDGRTEPDSEVEIYVNNQLLAFDRADQLGYYRFTIPLQFGTTRITREIITPDGRRLTESRQLQVPFVFLPAGHVSYQLQGGLTETGFGPDERDQLVGHGNVGVGLTRWLTVRGGAEYDNRLGNHEMLYYGAASARLFGNMLLNADVLPGYYYRSQLSYTSYTTRSLNIDHTWFDGPSQFNGRGASQQLNLSVYTPLFSRSFRRGSSVASDVERPVRMSRINGGLRLNAAQILIGDVVQSQASADLFLRVRSVNMRFSYRDNLFYTTNFDEFTATGGQLTGSLTYSLPRTSSVPVWMRGSFLRVSADYDRQLEQLRQVDVQTALSLGNSGRVTVSATRQLITDITTFQAGLTLDLRRRGGASSRSTNRSMQSGTSRNPSLARSATDYRGTSTGLHSIRQSIRGSVGFDDTSNRLIFTDRQQVGRSGVSLRLFVDENNNGRFDPGEEILPFNAVRLDRSAGTALGRDGLLRFTQMQAYYQYNLDVNRRALPNPQLVPAKEQFSIVTDPNQFKHIDIPFYRSGTIEGTVYMTGSGVGEGPELHASLLNGSSLNTSSGNTAALEGQGGLRLTIVGQSNGYTQQIRTFFGGGFYAMDIPPGSYTLEVDPAQLDFLGVQPRGGVLAFTIQSLAEGDYLPDLEMILEPVGSQDDSFRLDDLDAAVLDELRTDITRMMRDALGSFVQAQFLVYQGDLLQAIDMINQSLASFETSQALALKGTIYFLSGSSAMAERYWQRAVQKNPGITLPSQEQLESIRQEDFLLERN